jgi:hypothetical protein
VPILPCRCPDCGVFDVIALSFAERDYITMCGTQCPTCGKMAPLSVDPRVAMATTNPLPCRQGIYTYPD